MKTYRAVLWDMDGTLVDSEPLAVRALAAAMREQDLHVPHDLHDRVVGRASDDLYRWLVAEHGLALDAASWEQRKLHHYLSGAETLRSFEPAVSCWLALASASIPQAVISNSDRMIVDVNLAAIGLSRPGLVTVSRNDVRRGKPDPEGYLRAAYLLGLPAAHCLIVEDSLSGAAAGLAAGMAVAFVPHATVPAPPGVKPLSSMNDILTLAGSGGPEQSRE